MRCGICSTRGCVAASAASDRDRTIAGRQRARRGQTPLRRGRKHQGKQRVDLAFGDAASQVVGRLQLFDVDKQLARAGVRVGRHRVRRLMRLLGLEAIYRKPRTSVANPEHRVYPYLLRGLTIERPNQVWCADITYIPVPAHGLRGSGRYGISPPCRCRRAGRGHAQGATLPRLVEDRARVHHGRPRNRKGERPGDLEQLQRALLELDGTRVMWERRLWRLVGVQALPTTITRLDDAIVFRIEHLPGSEHGPLIDRDLVRRWGAVSAPAWRTSLRLAYLWDKAKAANNGARIYATRPVVARVRAAYHRVHAPCPQPSVKVWLHAPIIGRMQESLRVTAPSASAAARWWNHARSHPAGRSGPVLGRSRRRGGAERTETGGALPRDGQWVSKS